MASSFNDRIKYENPAAGQCNWDAAWYRNQILDASMFGPVLDGNFVVEGLEISDNGGLSVSMSLGSCKVDGTEFDLITANHTMQAAPVGDVEINVIYVDDSGAVQVTQAEPNETCVVLALVDTDDTDILRITDCRKMAEIAVDLPPVAARKNILINGDGIIQERNSTDGLALADKDFIVDKFYLEFNNGAFKTDIDTNRGTDGFGVEVVTAASFAAAGSYLEIATAVESQDARELVDNGGTVVLSFKMKSSVTGIHSFGIAAYSGAVSTKRYCAEFTITVADTFESFEIPITFEAGLMSHDGAGRGFNIYLAAVTGTTFQGTPDAWSNVGFGYASPNAVNWAATPGNKLLFKNLQLELGEVASPMEKRSYDEELSLCQRYFQKINIWRSGWLPNTAASSESETLIKTMRSAPVILNKVVSNLVNATAVNFAALNNQAVFHYPTGGISASTTYQITADLDADL